jgi:hypothetical protein
VAARTSFRKTRYPATPTLSLLAVQDMLTFRLPGLTRRLPGWLGGTVSRASVVALALAAVLVLPAASTATTWYE